MHLNLNRYLTQQGILLHTKSVELQGLPMKTHYEKDTKKVFVEYITSNFFLVTIVLETSGKFLLYIGSVEIFRVYFSEPSF